METTWPAGSLHIPVLNRVTPGSFNTRPTAIMAWLDDLPMGDDSESARRLILALKTTNQLDISDKIRCRIVDAFQPYITEISSRLKQHYTNQGLPLTTKNQHIAAFVVNLHAEMATGYNILIEHRWMKKLSFLTSKSMARYIHHAMFYLNRMLLAHYEIYSDPPQYTWKHIHQLYLYAEINNLHNQQICNTTTALTMQPCTIDDLYKQTVLLGLISPFRLQQAETRKVHQSLAKWSNLCKVLPKELPKEHFSGNSDQILLNLKSDNAPGYHFVDTSISHNTLRTIDNSALIRHISESAVTKQPPSKQDTEEIAYDVMKLLIITWSGKSKRLFARTPRQNNLCATIGLSATHFIIHNLQHADSTSADHSPFQSLVKSFTKSNGSNTSNSNTSNSNISNSNISNTDINKANEITQGIEPSFDTRAEFASPNLLGIATVNNTKPDVWDESFDKADQGHYQFRINNDVKDAKSFASYASINVNTVNESAGGYCLLGYAEEKTEQPRVQIGEVIGIRDSADNTDTAVSIGVVTRLKNQHNGIQIGVLKLAACADAVATCPYHKRQMQQKHDRSLLLPAIKSVNQAQTLLLNPQYKENDELLVDKHGYKLRVKLSKLISTTSNVNRFEFDITKIIGVELQPKHQEEPNTQGINAEWTLI